nr:hypothetical protein [Tanacetum cinerariifolium]
MVTIIEQQVALDEAFVPSTQRLRIRRSNFRLPSDIQSKESTLQVVYDVLRSCPFFKVFFVTADVPEIYMQEFWATAYVHQHFISFKLDNKKHIINLETFRDMLHICPRIPSQSFDELPFEEEIMEFLRTEAQQLKIILRRSRQETHISQPSGSGMDEGTGSKSRYGVYFCDCLIPGGTSSNILTNNDSIHHSHNNFNKSCTNSSNDNSKRSSSNLPTFDSVFRFDERLKSLEASFSKYIQTNPFAEAISNIPADISEIELKKILIEKMEGNKSIQRSNEQRNLYKALVEAYEADKIILDTYGERVILKRRRDDDDDQGSKSRQASVSESAFVEEPVQTTSQIEEPLHLVFETAAQGSTQTWIIKLAKQADSRSSFNNLLYTQLDFSNFIMNRLRVDTLTPELLAGPTYELMKGSCNSLTELEYHLEEVYKATTDQLDWVNPEGASSRKYTTSMTKIKAADYGHIKWIEDLKRQQFYGFAVNQESALDVYSKRRIIAVTDLKIVEWHNYKHLDWILLSNLTVKEHFAFNVSLRMFTRSIIIQRRVKDLQLGVKSYQKRLNLTKPDTYRSDLKRREAYSAYSNPRGFIYQNKDKKNRLMRIDELHKFNDRTLNDVCNALDDRLKGIRMQYLPQTIWRKGDKDRAAAMIQDIDKMLKTMRIMRSLERFVGGRLYEGDFWMLQRTI